MPEPGGRAASSPLVGGVGRADPGGAVGAGPAGLVASPPSTCPRPLSTCPRPPPRLPPLPEVAERDLVAHFTRLAHRSFGVDLGAYPLGSCTMKYNPKVCDWAAELPGWRDLHPATPPRLRPGRPGRARSRPSACSARLTGMARATFQPPAGAAGELTGLLIMRAYHASQGNPRSRVIIPDSAHGTNPASVSLAGYEAVPVPSNARGHGRPRQPCAAWSTARVAGLMLTNPNTLGLFEEEITDIAAVVHEAGGLVYYDGANLNAILGIARPGDMGFDIVHSNLHKTFATPHGGGGPGAGPVAVVEHLARFLPGPLPARLRRRHPRLGDAAGLDRAGARRPRQLPGGGAGPGLHAGPGRARPAAGRRALRAQRPLPRVADRRRVRPALRRARACTSSSPRPPA